MSDYVKIEWMLVGTGIFMIAETLLLLGNKTLIETGRNLQIWTAEIDKGKHNVCIKSKKYGKINREYT